MYAMRIRHAVFVESLQAEYKLTDASVYRPTPEHGGNVARQIRIPFQTQRGEMLTEVNGLTDHRFLYSLIFVTTDGSGLRRSYVMHSRPESIGLQSFTLRERVIGFYGRSGGAVGRLGFYYIGWCLRVGAKLLCTHWFL